MQNKENYIYKNKIKKYLESSETKYIYPSGI